MAKRYDLLLPAGNGASIDEITPEIAEGMRDGMGAAGADDLATETAARVAAVHFSDVGLPELTDRYIIPVMRNSVPLGSEALGLWTSKDGYTYQELYPGDLFLGKDSADNVRDPSIIIRPNGDWYLGYTAGTFGQVPYWGLAKSTDQGKTWTWLAFITVPGSVAAGAGCATWGPSWFLDPATGKAMIVLSVAYTSGGHDVIIMRPTSDDWLTWDAGQRVKLIGPAGTLVNAGGFDCRITYGNGFYYLIVREGNLPVIYRSANVQSGYSLFCRAGEIWKPSTAGTLEQCFLTQVGEGGGHWLANFVAPGTSKLYVSESFDGMRTWTTPVQTLDYSTNAHQFSELVRLASPSKPGADVPPGNPVPAFYSGAASGTLSGAAFTSVFNTAEGTIRFRATRAAAEAAGYLFSFVGSTGLKVGPLAYRNGTTLLVRYNKPDNVELLGSDLALTVDTFDIVLSWRPLPLDVNRFRCWINGVEFAMVQGHVVAVPVATDQTSLEWGASGMTGVQLEYFPFMVDSPIQLGGLAGLSAAPAATLTGSALAANVTSASINALTGNLALRPAASATPANNGDMTFQLTSNTSLAIKVKGSDGTVRSATLTLA
jgi:hypothetical protein